MREWISIKDRLPEKNKKVMVFDYWEEKKYMASLDDSENWIAENGCHLIDISHWMPFTPLPPNPKMPFDVEE